MPSRPFPPTPSPHSPIKVIFLVLTISSSLLIIFTIIYLLYHLWYALQPSSKTIPFDSIVAPFKLKRFSFKELKIATTQFDESNIIGKGGSGTVFRGILSDGKLIAVKRLDSVSLQTEKEFQNELQILGGLRSNFLVSILGYCNEKNKRILVYEYMPNRSLQECLFGDVHLNLSWERRFAVILDVVKALEYLHLGCDPPVIHGDIKPSNVLLDSDYRARISDFGLSRIKIEGEFGVELFSQDLGMVETPAVGTPPTDSSHEVDFALALQASCSSKNSSRTCYDVKALNLNSLNFNVNLASDSEFRIGNGKGKEIFNLDVGREDWKKFVPYDDELCSIDHVKESNPTSPVVDDMTEDTKPWGKDWWWRQDGNVELCSKDYVREWIGSQISPSTNSEWDEEKNIPDKPYLDNSIPLEKSEDGNEARLQEAGVGDIGKDFEGKAFKVRKIHKKKHRKMQDWWNEEQLAEMSKKGSTLKNLKTKWKKGFKMPHFDLARRFHFRIRKKFGEQNQIDRDANGEFSFRRGWKKNKTHSMRSDLWSGDLFSRELSSTTSMRGTLCYVAPEYGGCGYLMEKADIYSLGVLILVIVSGRRPLHVLASPMKLEKANLISWCRQLAQAGNILELVDERLKDEYDKDQASLCINVALTCLQKMPELRPDIVEILKMLRGEMDLPPTPFKFSPSPPSKLISRSRRTHKTNAAE